MLVVGVLLKTTEYSDRGSERLVAAQRVVVQTCVCGRSAAWNWAVCAVRTEKPQRPGKPGHDDYFPCDSHLFPWAGVPS